MNVKRMIAKWLVKKLHTNHVWRRHPSWEGYRCIYMDCGAKLTSADAVYYGESYGRW